MPSVSKAQQRFMAAVASGSLKKPGLSPDKAKEYLVAGKKYQNLPEHKFKKLHKLLKG